MRVFFTTVVFCLVAGVAFSQDFVQQRRAATQRKAVPQAAVAKSSAGAKSPASAGVTVATATVRQARAAASPAKTASVPAVTPSAAAQADNEDYMHVTVISPSDDSSSSDTSYNYGGTTLSGTAESGLPYSFGPLKAAYQQTPGVMVLVFEDSSRVVRVVHLKGAGKKAVWEVVTEMARSRD